MSSCLKKSLATVVASGVSLGCFPPTDGREPPLDRLYFPVGIALSGESGQSAPDDSVSPARWMYVVNSDFDLQFNAGSLQAYDLDRLRSFLPAYCESHEDCADTLRCDLPGEATNSGAPSYTCVDPADPRPCGDLGDKSVADRLIAPGRCGFLDPVAPPRGGPVLVQSVGIGAFVTDVVFRAPPEGAGNVDGRLFMPVRGDATLHWVDVRSSDDSPGLDCGQGSSGRCDSNHRRGANADEENARSVELPAEPFGVAVDEQGEAILVTHQVDGQVGLFVNDWEGGAAGGPRLEFVLGGLPSGALAVASVPEAAVVNAGTEAPLPHEPGFLVTFRNSAEVRLVRYFDEEAASPARPFLEASRTAAISTNAQGFNSRGIAVDDRDRDACEARVFAAFDASDPGLRDALLECARIPLRVFVANRSPATLILGETQPNASETSSDDLPQFFENVPVAFGASRVVVGDVIDRDGQRSRRVFVACFDTRKIFIYDPDGARVEAIIDTGRGPHGLAIDPGSGLGFVSHFTDSYVGVIDLDQRHTQHYGQIILTVGRPTPPRASK